MPAARLTRLSLLMTVCDTPAPLAGDRRDLRTAWWPVVRVIGFTVTSLELVFVHPGRFRTHVPGNPGDAFLILALLKWGGDHVSSLYSGYWQGPMFSSGHDAMAYTETFLPLTIPFRIVEELTGSPIVAMNVLYILGWVLCAECTYHLFVRLTSCRSVSVVGAMAFTFSTIRISQTGHFQLVYAFGIPLGLLLMFRMIEKPTIVRGVLLGATLAVQFLTTAYYGLIITVSVAAISVVALLRTSEHALRRQLAWALASSAAVVLVLAGPVALRYSSLQSSSLDRGQYPAGFALRLGDLRTAAPLSTHLADLSILRNDSATRSSENFAYIGLFAAILVPVFVAAAIGSRTFRSRLRLRRNEIAATLIVGVFGFLIAVGRGPILGIRTPFYDLARILIPGVKSILALVRLVVFTQLALVLIATIVLTSALAHLRARSLRVAACVLLSLFVGWESSAGIPLVRVPKVGPGSVYDALRKLDAGIVVELPMAPRGTGTTYAFLEATRLVLASGDNQRSVNGYSGFSPKGYDDVVTTLNTFPSEDSRRVLAELGVDYVLIHTAPVDTGLDPVTERVNESGFAYVSNSQLDQIVRQVPQDAVRSRIQTSDGVILVLATP